MDRLYFTQNNGPESYISVTFIETTIAIIGYKSLGLKSFDFGLPSGLLVSYFDHKFNQVHSNSSNEKKTTY